MSNVPAARFISTFSGHRIWFEDKNRQYNVYVIEDIAHSLASLARYVGHTSIDRQPVVYSVAQHSVLASYMVPLELAPKALMHDSSEAYTGDVNSPLKFRCPELKRIESAIQMEIASDCGMHWPYPPEIKQADLLLLATEAAAFDLDTTDWDIPESDPELEKKIRDVWNPIVAKRKFLERWAEIRPEGSII